MLAFIVLLLAALSRFWPFMMHQHAGINFTAVWAGLLFFGSRRPRWEALVAAAVMAVTDVLLTKFVYDYPFYVREYVVTWAWYVAAALIGSGLLRKVTVLRVAASVLASATGFFVVADVTEWAVGHLHLYPHTPAGLVACFVAALPFYRNDLISTGFFAGVFFGLPVVAAKLVEQMQTQHSGRAA